MIVHAELSCLNCGYDLGIVEGRRGAPLKDLVFLSTHQGDVLEMDGRGHGVCPRCKGRVLPHGVTPVRCLYVGDSERDVTAALAAGMQVIVARYGYIEPHEAPDAWPAHGHIEHPRELMAWLPNNRT